MSPEMDSFPKLLRILDRTVNSSLQATKDQLTKIRNKEYSLYSVTGSIVAIIYGIQSIDKAVFKYGISHGILKK